MLVILVIVLLWLCLSGLIYFIIRNKKVSLSVPQVLVFFACKIIAGAAYGYIFKRFYNGDDTWKLNQDGFQQYKRLLATPGMFFGDFFSAEPVPGGGIFNFQSNSYIQNLEYAIVGKTVALFNFISQGNYYINMVLFNFLGFWGCYFLYKLVAAQFSMAGRRLTAAILFLFPPAVFWLSGLRTEGFLLLFTGVMLYNFSRWLNEKKTTCLLISMVCFALAVILRNGFALAMAPALTAWGWTVFYKTGIKKTFAITYAICLTAIACVGFVWPGLNIFSLIAGRQHDFFLLKGNTRFNLTALEPTILSFIKVFPESLINTFIRPFPWEAKGLLQWFSAMENMLVLLLVICTGLMYRKQRNIVANPALVCMLVMAALGNYVLIGYVVPFPGAIVRYKIIPELFLITACLAIVQPSRYKERITQ